MDKVEQLMSASRSGNIDTVKNILSQKPGFLSRILGRGITVHTKDKNDQKPLHHAALGGHIDIMKFLLDSGAPISDKDKWGESPLHKTAREGSIEAATLLLEKGASIDDANEDGSTSLHIAARNGHIDFVRFLLRQGANWNRWDKEGNLPLLSSLTSGNLAITDELLSASGSSDLPDSQKSPLLNTGVLWHPNAVRWLLHHGANPNVADDKGDTPLHLVTSRFFLALLMETSLETVLETLCILLEAGANVHARNQAGKTPFDEIPSAVGTMNALDAGMALSLSNSRFAKENGELILSQTNAYSAIAKQVSLILTSYAESSTPQEFASKALVKVTKNNIPFYRISHIYQAVIEALRVKYPEIPVSDLVKHSIQAFDFVCPKCGLLDKQSIALAVSAKLVQEMNPDLTPVFYGPDSAAVFRGWCPKCHSVSVEASFDPAKLKLDHGQE